METRVTHNHRCEMTLYNECRGMPTFLLKVQAFLPMPTGILTRHSRVPAGLGVPEDDRPVTLFERCIFRPLENDFAGVRYDG